MDKDLDEEEDLNLLEQEAVMPLQELLAKLREVNTTCCLSVKQVDIPFYRCHHLCYVIIELLSMQE